MKLAEYLKRNGLTHQDFGTKISVSQAAISRYVNGERFPDKEMQERIFVATGGDVTPNDFCDLEPLGAEAGEQAA